MSEYINESLLDASPIKKQKEESAKLVAKWDKSGLLEGMENDWQKSGGTAPKTKIITEESQVADRFRKLAGLNS